MGAHGFSEHQKDMTVQGPARTELILPLPHSMVKVGKIVSHNVGNSSYVVERKETLISSGDFIV